MSVCDWHQGSRARGRQDQRDPCRALKAGDTDGGGTQEGTSSRVINERLSVARKRGTRSFEEGVVLPR